MEWLGPGLIWGMTLEYAWRELRYATKILIEGIRTLPYILPLEALRSVYNDKWQQDRTRWHCTARGRNQVRPSSKHYLWFCENQRNPWNNIWLKFETDTSEKGRIAMLNTKASVNGRMMKQTSARAQRRVAVSYAIRLLYHFLAYKQDLLYFSFLFTNYL